MGFFVLAHALVDDGCVEEVAGAEFAVGGEGFGAEKVADEFVLVDCGVVLTEFDEAEGEVVVEGGCFAEAGLGSEGLPCEGFFKGGLGGGVVGGHVLGGADGDLHDHEFAAAGGVVAAAKLHALAIEFDGAAVFTKFSRCVAQIKDGGAHLEGVEMRGGHKEVEGCFEVVAGLADVAFAEKEEGAEFELVDGGGCTAFGADYLEDGVCLAEVLEAAGEFAACGFGGSEVGVDFGECDGWAEGEEELFGGAEFSDGFVDFEVGAVLVASGAEVVKTLGVGVGGGFLCEGWDGEGGKKA